MDANHYDPPLIAVVIPFYQKTAGLLTKALTSVIAQTLREPILPIVADDGSPVSARAEIQKLPEANRSRVLLLEQANKGAGAARNLALESVPHGTKYVAFLDSDDTWRPDHLNLAVQTLSAGNDVYFADWWSFNHPHTSNFQRIGALPPDRHEKITGLTGVYKLGVSPLEHITKDGGGVIQTSTVVYDFSKYSKLRFREEFYNGQDFFFWMDLGELNAEFAFSTTIDAENGEGINIYQGAGWGTERSLARLRNEIFVWTSVRRLYQLTPAQYKSNQKTISLLEDGVIRDIIHRVRRKKTIDKNLLIDIARYDPMFIVRASTWPIRVLRGNKSNRRRETPQSPTE